MCSVRAFLEDEDTQALGWCCSSLDVIVTREPFDRPMNQLRHVNLQLILTRTSTSLL